MEAYPIVEAARQDQRRTVETAIREDRSITAPRRQEIEDARFRALADTEWLHRHRRGGQAEKSEYAEWNGWLGRRVEG
jgi:hypothetical protein